MLNMSTSLICIAPSDAVILAAIWLRSLLQACKLGNNVIPFQTLPVTSLLPLSLSTGSFHC